MREFLNLLADLVIKLPEWAAINAVNLAREAFALGEQHAKATTPPAPPRCAVDLVPVVSLIRQGEHIKAIKEIRTQTSLGLKESKDFADALRRALRDAADFWPAGA